MTAHRIGALAVTSAKDSNKIIGIVTERGKIFLMKKKNLFHSHHDDFNRFLYLMYLVCF